MYKQEITCKHRTAFVIAVDQSLSMRGNFLKGLDLSVNKAETVAQAVNELLCELENRARREGVVRNYFDVAVLGYSSGRVTPLLDSQRNFVPVSELRCSPHERRTRIVARRTRNGGVRYAEELSEEWIAPVASGNTPMHEAFWAIRNIVRDWCADPRNADSFPPVVINITDGEASDCDARELLEASSEIRRLGTSDGNVLLMNVHITEGAVGGALVFPTDDEIGDDDRYARLMADCSSIMPSAFNALIADLRGDNGLPPYRAMGYNASPKDLFAMLNIGSRSVTGIR